MNLKNKTLALVVASALVMPSALAVEGSDGMHYTSASEGFYASIRVRFNSGSMDGANAIIENSSSRLGIQGSSEMSHGLEGFYRYETAFDVNNGDQGFGNTRIANVGLRGGFGSVRIGSDWSDEYNFVFGNTDIANVNSGNFAYNAHYAGRSKQSIFYKSPDFNGLQVAARFQMDGGNDATGDKMAAQMEVDAAIPDPSMASDADIQKAALGIANNLPDAELDAWALSAKYEFSGFSLAGMYSTTPDAIYAVNAEGGAIALGDLEDLTAWALSGTYSQDNWSVASWYGQNNYSDLSNVLDDETVFSIAGNVSIGPSGVYVVHETKEDGAGQDDALTAFGVEYKFNSKAKTWIEYAAQDKESAEGAEDYVTIGLRHDF